MDTSYNQGQRIYSLRRPTVTTSNTHYVPSRVLKFQVGYLLAEGRGYSNDIEVEFPRLRVADDLTIEFLRGTLRFSRTSRGILVQGSLQTSIPGECNRCLDSVPVALTVPLEELYVYPPEPGVEFTVADDGILDLAPLLREEIVLEIPIGILCKPDCAGLCPECGQNFNTGTCTCAERQTDPRMAALRALRDKLSEE